MSSFFSSDGSFTLQFALIFIVIFLILAGGVYLLRRLTGDGSNLSHGTPPRGRQPRLGIVDIYELDRQRQLILLRRDNVEHLLLVGGPNDVVVERNITRGINARLATEDAAYEADPEPIPAELPAGHAPFQTPSEPTQAYATPHPGLAATATYAEPGFEMPVVLPPPIPGSASVVRSGARPLDLSQADPREDIPTPSAETRPAKESPFARVIRRAPPSLVNLVPAVLADRVRSPAREPEPALFADEPAPAPVVAPPATRTIDPAILSDMARQLEEALRRPSAAVRPAAPMPSEPMPSEPMPFESARPEPTADAAEPHDGVEPPAPEIPADPAPMPDFATAPGGEAQSVDPVAAAMAAVTPEPAPAPPVEAAQTHEPPVADAPEPAPSDAEPVFVVLPVPEAVPDSSPAGETARHDPVDPQPVAEAPVVHAVIADAPRVDEPPPAAHDTPPVPAPEAPAPVPEPPTAPKPAATLNPFSVEEIEAEFARLLGRPLDRKQ